MSRRASASRLSPPYLNLHVLELDANLGREGILPGKSHVHELQEHGMSIHRHLACSCPRAWPGILEVLKSPLRPLAIPYKAHIEGFAQPVQNHLQIFAGARASRMHNFARRLHLPVGNEYVQLQHLSCGTVPCRTQTQCAGSPQSQPPSAVTSEFERPHGSKKALMLHCHVQCAQNCKSQCQLHVYLPL